MSDEEQHQPTDQWVVWVLGAIMLVVIAANIFTINRLLHLTNELQDTKADAAQTTLALNVGCKAGNKTRRGSRFTFRFLAKTAEVVAANSADAKIANYFKLAQPILLAKAVAPEYAARDCDALYPVNPRQGG